MRLFKTLVTLLASSSLLALAACGTSIIGGGTGAGGTGAGGETNAGGSSADGGGTLGCAATFDKDCTADTDCVTKLHQINCCGTRVAIGINTSQSAAFDAAEAQCDAQYPACGCAEEATKAEDGKTLPDYGNDFPVACQAGQCRTYVPDAPACNGVPSPETCTETGCPAGFTCTPDPDPTTCHPSSCSCSAQGWVCDQTCLQNGSTCMKGL